MGGKLGAEQLFVILITLIVWDVEVAQLIHALGGRYDVHIVTKLLLLEVLFGKVLQVALREWELSRDEDLGLLTIDLHLVTKIARLAVHLDALHQEALELVAVEQAILQR